MRGRGSRGGTQRRKSTFLSLCSERQRIEKGVLDSAEGDEASGEEWAGDETEEGAGETQQDRAKVRAAALERRRREERALQQQQQEEEETEESEESGYSEASEDEQDEANVVLHKPVCMRSRSTQ